MLDTSTKSQLYKRLIREFNNKRLKIPPKINTDWNLIWVLTAKEIRLDEVNEFNINDTRNRLQTGINLAKKIAAQKTHKKTSSLEDLIYFSPEIYISGYNKHNVYFRILIKQNYFLDNFAFPESKIKIGPNEGIQHTGHQFDYFPKHYLQKHNKIVLITDAYHLPRVIRYARKYPLLRKKLVFYPSLPINLEQQQVASEINKIITYSNNGIIPL